jgi:hypothetical protein
MSVQAVTSSEVEKQRARTKQFLKKLRLKDAAFFIIFGISLQVFTVVCH